MTLSVGRASLDADYFERIYAAAGDPWSFATSAYERGKYATTLKLLGTRRYVRGLEVGCSIGVLTARLATRCDELCAIDINARALTTARARCSEHRNVRFQRMTFPRDVPDGHFDLVVVSEVGYYWSDDDLALARERICERARGGTLQLVHFLPKVDDYVRDGDAVHAAFLADRRFTPVRAVRRARYRIDVVRVAS